MPWPIYLAVIVTAAATSILKYEDGTNMNSENAISKIISQRVPKQHLYKFHSNQGDGHVALKADSEEKSHPALIECNVTAGVANCSNLGINDLSDIKVQTDITGLDLSHNNIKCIPDKVLVNFTNLKWLNVSHNNLQKLSNNSFYNLSALVTLKLNSNNLSMTEKTFPVDVFKPLVNLQLLWIQNNTNINDVLLDYPDMALAHLKSVKYLRMDGLPNKILGEGFKSMTSLTNLTLKGHDLYGLIDVTGGHCNLTSLPGDMFVNVPNLTYLKLYYCKIKGKLVNSTVFEPLTNLTFLDLSHNDDLNFNHLSAALENIRHYPIKVLKITNIVNPYSPGVKVTTAFCKSLPRELEDLNATSNAMETFEDGAMQCLPKTLKYVDVGSNRFLFWTYLQDLAELVSLKILTLSKGDIYNLPWYYPPKTNDTHAVNLKGTKLSNHDDRVFLIQSLPPQLEEINMINGGWSNYLTEFHFNETNVVKILNLHYNNFPILKGPIVGLHSLYNLSMPGCGIKTIYRSFFQNLTSLRFLNLSTNYFGNYAFQSNVSPLFSDLVNLKVLDLSFTDIRNISELAFQGLDNLEVLLLQRNPFYSFEVDISFMTHLRYIDLSSTSLTSITKRITRILDNIRTTSHNFSIELTANKFNCFCSDIHFIKWLSTTHVLTKEVEFTCLYVDGSDKPVTSLNDLYGNLRRECASNLKLFSIVISATFLLIFVIAGIVIFHFRRRLQYLYHIAVLRYKDQSGGNPDESFEYDVFVSYAHEDHDFVVNELHPQLQSKGLKIHIHGLHFIAGEYITSNIVNAVRSSRHTLVVLTQHHVSSKWSKFEVEMANMEQVHTGRSVLVFLIMENIPKLTHENSFYIKNNTYINFPRPGNNQMELQVFWSRLVSALKK